MIDVAPLAEFLFARIAETKAAAEQVDADHWDTDFSGWMYPDVAELMGKFSPARVVADCDAKRLLVEVLLPIVDLGLIIGYGSESAVTALRTLGTSYVDHPDYDAEWRL